MARLTAKQRAKLPASAFAYPKTRRYPVHDPSHARNALARVAQKGTSGSPAKVKRAVGKRWGGRIKVSRKRRPMTRR